MYLPAADLFCHGGTEAQKIEGADISSAPLWQSYTKVKRSGSTGTLLLYLYGN